MGFLSNLFSGAKNLFSGIFGGGNKGQPQPMNTFTPPSVSPYQPLSGAEANPLGSFNTTVPGSNSSIAQYGSSTKPGGVYGKALDNIFSAGHGLMDSMVPSTPKLANYMGGTIKGTNTALGNTPTALPAQQPDWLQTLFQSFFPDPRPKPDPKLPLSKGEYASLKSPMSEFYVPDAPMASASPALPNIVSPTAPVSGNGVQNLGKKFWEYLTSEKEDGSNSVMDSFTKQIPGAAVSILGNMLSPKVDSPDLSGIYNDLQSRMQGGTNQNPATTAAIERLLSTVKGDPSAPPDSAFTAGDLYNDEQLQKDLKNFDSYWKAIRPNADYTSDSEYQKQRAEIIEQARTRRTAARDELSFQYNQQQLQERYNSAVQLLNLDQTQMNQYIQLAQLPIAEILRQTELDIQSAQEFKDFFGQFGAGITQDQLGVNPIQTQGVA